MAADEKQSAENLIKILSRCLKMFDAQNEIYKIINLIEARLEKLREFKKLQCQSQPEANKFAALYRDLVRFSGRIHAELRILKSIEKSLSRPFMFNGKMYDDDYMHA